MKDHPALDQTQSAAPQAISNPAWNDFSSRRKFLKQAGGACFAAAIVSQPAPSEAQQWTSGTGSVVDYILFSWNSTVSLPWEGPAGDADSNETAAKLKALSAATAGTQTEVTSTTVYANWTSYHAVNKWDPELKIGGISQLEFINETGYPIPNDPTTGLPSYKFKVKINPNPSTPRSCKYNVNDPGKK